MQLNENDFTCLNRHSYFIINYSYWVTLVQEKRNFFYVFNEIITINVEDEWN